MRIGSGEGLGKKGWEKGWDRVGDRIGGEGLGIGLGMGSAIQLSTSGLHWRSLTVATSTHESHCACRHWGAKKASLVENLEGQYGPCSNVQDINPATNSGRTGERLSPSIHYLVNWRAF